MPTDYHILASFDGALQLGQFSQEMTGHLIDYAQRHNWMGRHITDFGCGTGGSLYWLLKHGYLVTGIDQSEAMLALAQAHLAADNLSARLIHGQYLQTQPVNDQDMVLALNTLNELQSIRELERAFKVMAQILKQGQWLIFDMFTIEGLVTRNQAGYSLDYNTDDLTIFVGNQFDYERSIQSRNYIIFQKEGAQWQRHNATQTLRAYPIQGVTALLQRSGYALQHVLNIDFSDHTPGDSTPRVIIMAIKQ